MHSCFRPGSGDVCVLDARAARSRLRYTCYKRFLIALGFACGLIALACQAGYEPPDFRPDRILLKPKTEQHLSNLAAMHLRQRATVLWTFANLGGLQVVRLPEGLKVADTLAAYRQAGAVEFAEPDYWVRASMEPNDPEYLKGTLWGLKNVGQNRGVAGIDIDAPAGWDIQHCASNVIVAIVDSGINYRHIDLADNLWTNPQEVAGDGLDNDGDGFVDDLHGIDAVLRTGDPQDDSGHGTMLAGIIGAAGDNGQGAVGVAWHLQILACKFLDQQGNGSISDAIACIDYARSRGARIINASWNTAAFSQSLREAILRARDDGIIFVASAGNGGQDNDLNPSYPCGYGLDNIVAVTAVDRRGQLLHSANYGATSVALAAPGADIYSTWNESNNTYALSSGTSMATAYVSGVCALARAVFPDETHPQIIARILNTTKPLPSLAGKCQTGGILRLKAALGSIKTVDGTGNSTRYVSPKIGVPPVFQLAAVRASPGRAFQLQIVGAPGTLLRWETSTNLADWDAFQTNAIPPGGFWELSYPNFGDSPQRFFRAAALP